MMATTVAVLVSVAVGHGKATLRWTVPVSNGNGSGVTGYTVDGPGGTRAVGAGVREVAVSGLTVRGAPKSTTLRARMLKPGDTFEPIYRTIDQTGSPQDVLSGTPLTFGKDPFQVTDAPGLNCRYNPHFYFKLKENFFTIPEDLLTKSMIYAMSIKILFPCIFT